MKELCFDDDTANGASRLVIAASPDFCLDVYIVKVQLSFSKIRLGELINMRAKYDVICSYIYIYKHIYLVFFTYIMYSRVCTNTNITNSTNSVF